MKIGIIGTGNMGRAIGLRFARLGHEVVFGARTPADAEAVAAKAGAPSRAASNDDAARDGEVLVWTMRDTDPSAVLRDPSVLSGKVVINVNNRDYANEVKSGAWFSEAIAERFQANAPDARVVKALNVVAMEALDVSAERLREAGAQVFIAGNDAGAKSVVTGLLAELGFEAVDLGAGGVAFRAAEALADVIRMLMIDGGRGGANLQVRTLPKPDLALIGERQASNYH